MLKLRFRNNASLRPPKVILVGPPGSGRSTQSVIISEMFGLVKISMRDLLRKEIQKNPVNGRIISKCMNKGALVPDDIVNTLMQERLSKSDCSMRGWIIDGFPHS